MKRTGCRRDIMVSLVRHYASTCLNELRKKNASVFKRFHFMDENRLPTAERQIYNTTVYVINSRMKFLSHVIEFHSSKLLNSI
jgi:hypothetical protein